MKILHALDRRQRQMCIRDRNTIFIKLFPEGKRPARTIYEAAALPFGAKVKITGTAVKDLEV